MKGCWPVSMETGKATEINRDLSAWGYKSRAEFVEKAHAKEKEERAADKKAGRASK